MLYCRRCDLAFCEEHKSAHDNLTEPPPNNHPALQENPDATFCSICVGLYRPKE